MVKERGKESEIENEIEDETEDENLMIEWKEMIDVKEGVPAETENPIQIEREVTIEEIREESTPMLTKEYDQTELITTMDDAKTEMEMVTMCMMTR